MKQVGTIVAAVMVAGIALAVSLGFVHYQNDAQALDVAVDTQWKQVENQLARQYELLPNLVTVTKQYAKHETELLDRLFEARTRYADAPPGKKPLIAQDFDGVLVQTLALAERYPDLKADRVFRDLSYEIAGSKNRIAVERNRYNEAVGRLNTRLRQIPWVWASAGIEEREFYNPSSEKLTEPEIAF